MEQAGNPGLAVDWRRPGDRVVVNRDVNGSVAGGKRLLGDYWDGYVGDCCYDIGGGADVVGSAKLGACGPALGKMSVVTA